MEARPENAQDLPTRRIRESQEELAERIARAVPDDGRIEPRPGVFLNRYSVAGESMYAVLEPSFCVIAQGSKEVLVGEQCLAYDPAHFLIATMNLPVVAQVTEASRESPYLGFRLVLDKSVVTSVMVESSLGYEPGKGGGVRGIDVNPLNAELLDATLRLVRLLEQPEDYPTLAPLVVREIVYRLLKSEQGSRLRHLATLGGQPHRMVRAIETLRERYNESLRVEDLAREVNMSVSGFHAHFKAATALTPLQFLKEIRLQEARRLLLSEEAGAAEAGFRVGYDDASHFSRDYKRHFGAPPLRDVQQLREAAASTA